MPTATMARRPLGTLGKSGVVLALAWVAGFVDGVGYLLLFGVYTSHMTGNTAALGRRLDLADWRLSWKHAWPILAFVLGLMLGALLTEWGRRRRWHSRLSLVLGLELAVLVVLMATAPTAPASLAWLGLPALAMGMQTVTITKVGEQRVYSTFVTGTLSKLGEAVAGYLFWLADHVRARRRLAAQRRGWVREAVRHRLLGHAALNLGIWALFLLGGASGAAAELHWDIRSLWFPVVALAGLMLVDALSPIAAVGEGEPPGFAS